MKRLFAVVACFSLSAAASELVVAVSTEPPGLDPTTNAAAVIDLLLHHNLYQGLVQADQSGNLAGQLAETWEVSEDGRSWTFHLRPGITFHDGTPCDAAAVQKSFLRAMDPKTGHPHPEYYQGITAIEVVDSLTVRFQLSATNAAFLAVLAQGDSVIVPAERTDLPINPVGTGPFRFSEWRPGDRIVLERNPNYWRPEQPKLDRITFRFISAPSAQIAALRAGDVDLVAEAPLEVALTVADDPRFKVVSGPSNVVQIMAINKLRQPFADLRVRQAIAHAIDRNEIIDLVFFGYGTPIGSHLTPAIPYYADMTWLYPHDPDRARELLAAAGYPHGFSTTLTLPSNYPQHVRTGEVIAAQLRDVGIEVSIRLVDWGTWLERVRAQADYDLTVVGHIGKLDPAWMLVNYGPATPDYYFRRGWQSDEVDALLIQGEVTVDPEFRYKIYERVQYLIAYDVVNYFIQDMHAFLAMRAEVSGVGVFPDYSLDLTEASKG